ncbi:asparagine synthase-related protein [Fischerella thermalis]|uniref:asparagine synthase-related protein n=2 Tax=Fischerella thermalis TaxID=372787 RepID=UPI0011AEFC6D|nr:asparagine synthase-related protein [Fischerella thermalis]
MQLTSFNSVISHYSSEIFNTMRVGFTAIRRDSGVELELSEPKNNKETALVTLAQLPNHCALLMGRLYYQDELLASLKPHLSSQRLHECSSNAATLALEIYRQFGANSLERLEGDFALVVWDVQKAQLIGMRDPMGGYSLFWTVQGDTVAFSTSMRRLLDLLPQRSLSLEYLADFLIMSGQRNEGATEICAYNGIHRVLPGTIVSAHLNTCQVERRRYWDWQQKFTLPDSSDLPEVAQQYADVLRSAVRERLHGRTLAHLSGGMDSTSVALLARDEIGTSRGSLPLHTLSLVYEELPVLVRETPYIESVLEKETEIVAHRLIADKLLDFDSFIDTPPHDEPYAGLWRWAMDCATVEVASQVGAVTLLTGIGSDEIHDLHPYYLSDLLRQGRFLKAWQETVKWARAQNSNPWGIIQPFGIEPLVTAWLPFQPRSNKTQLNAQNDWSIPPWIRQDFAQRYALQSRTKENARNTYRLCEQVGLSITLNAIDSRPGDVLRWAVAATLGIAITHPFLDSRVLALGLGIQKRIPPQPGRMKPILGEAMRDLLPRQITQRKRKGHFNEVYYLGLTKNLQLLEEMLKISPIDELGIFDQNILIQALHEASLGVANARQLQRLDLSLCLIKWLSMQEEWLQRKESANATFLINRARE